MERKIELIQNSNDPKMWHWIILEWSKKNKGWHNVGCGLETSFEAAVSESKKEYDRLAAKDTEKKGKKKDGR